MSIYHCENCGCVEHLSIAPDCCSLCRGQLTCDDPVEASVEDLEARHFECMELAYAGEASTVPIAGPGLLPLTALALGLACLAAVLVMPSGLETCLETHGLDACHHALFR